MNCLVRGTIDDRKYRRCFGLELAPSPPNLDLGITQNLEVICLTGRDRQFWTLNGTITQMLLPYVVQFLHRSHWDSTLHRHLANSEMKGKPLTRV